MVTTNAIRVCRLNSVCAYSRHTICLPCIVVLFLFPSHAWAEESTSSVSDTDLLRIHKLFDYQFPSADIMFPDVHVYELTSLLEDGIDPFPVLREIAFDPKSPMGFRIKAIAWIGELANPDTREHPDERSILCLQELLKEILQNPDMQGDIDNTLGRGSTLEPLLTHVIKALSNTKDESSVDLMLPLASAEFWNSDEAPEIKLPPHVRLSPEQFRAITVDSIRTGSIYSIAGSGTERSLEIFGRGDLIDLSILSEMSRDGVLETAIYRRAGFTVIPDDLSGIPEARLKELEAIRQRVETQYLPLRGKPVE